MKLLDRYLLRRFFQFLLYALVASVLIFVTVDSTEQLDRFIDARVPYTVPLRYYYLYLPYIIYLTLPVSVLLSTLFAVGGLVYRNELTAMQSAGYSLWRVLLVLLLVALPLSLATLLFGETVVPAANHQRKQLYHVQVKKAPERASARHGRLYLQTSPNDYLKMESYDADLRTGERITLHTLDNGRLLRRVTAAWLRHSGKQWTLYEVQVRDFADGMVRVQRLDSLPRPDFQFSPEDLARVAVEPEEMNYWELRSLVERLTISGVRVGKWMVDLAFKISQPFAALIIVLFGVPFAVFRRRGGLVLGFGLSLLVCFVYFGVMQVGKILGYHGTIPPVLAAWSGNILFGVLGIVLVMRAPK